MDFNKVNLNNGFNHSVFDHKSLENLQVKTDYCKQQLDANYDEIVMWKENYFGSTQNINEPKGPKYTCNECNDIFNTRLSFFTHSKIHRKPFCILCGKYSTTEKEMYCHMKSFHQKFVRCERIQTNNYENLTNYHKNISNCESYLNDQSLNYNLNNNNNYGQRMPRKVGRPRKDVKNQQIYEVIEKPKQTITSRSGRCITMKVLDY